MLPALAALILAAPAADAEPLRLAIITGVNEPFEASQATLRWADDDAARWFELLSPQMDRIELLTLLDGESQPLFPAAASASFTPDRPGLIAALERLTRAADAAKRAGRRTELWFVYTGHGRVVGGEGEVKLLGSTLGRTELAKRVLSSRSFDRVHLVIDACDAYHLVNARGDAPAISTAFDEAFEQFVEGSSLTSFPHAGAILSTNGPGVTHEWSRYRGGIFSHEVRSALAGAADADGDRRIEYAEVSAFIAAANVDIPRLAGRPSVYVRPPALERSAALLIPRETAPLLELPGELAGHLWLEDDRGLRFAELHKASGQTVSLRLVSRPRYTLAAADRVAALDAEAERITPPFSWAPPPERRARGEGDAPPGAFSRPFDRSFAAGHAARLERPPAPLTTSAPEPVVPRWTGFALGSAAAVAIGASIWQGFSASAHYREHDEALRSPVRDGARELGDGARDRAIGLAIGGAAGAAASVLFFLLSS